MTTKTVTSANFGDAWVPDTLTSDRVLFDGTVIIEPEQDYRPRPRFGKVYHEVQRTDEHGTITTNIEHPDKLSADMLLLCSCGHYKGDHAIAKGHPCMICKCKCFDDHNALNKEL